jgi:hypothetical protein
MAKRVSNKTPEGVDLDYDFDDFDFDFEEPKVDKDRSPITRFAKGLFKGSKRAVTSGDFIRDAIKITLPRGFGEALDFSDRNATNLRNLYDESAKEIKPALKAIRKAALAIAPKDEEKIPKKVKTLLDKWKAEEEYERSTGAGPASREDNMSRTLREIFTAQAEQHTAERIRDVAERRVEAAMSEGRFKSLFAAVNATAVSTSRLDSYQTKITHRFQQKTLEIQYRQLFAIQDLIKLQADIAKRNESLLAGIAKNTGLPDAVKVNSSELRSQVFKTKLYERMADGIFGGRNQYIEKAFASVRSKILGDIKDIAGAMTDMSSAVVMGKEAMDGMDGMVDGWEEAGAAVGEMGTRIGSQYGMSYLRKKLIGSKLDKKLGISKKSTWLQRQIESAPNKLNEFRQSNKYWMGDSLKDAGLSWLQSMLPSSGVDTQIKRFGEKDMNTPYYITRRTDRSLNEVIPGYLSRIFRELQVIRTGNDKIELTKFDHQKSRFTTQGKIDSRIASGLVDKWKVQGLGQANAEILSMIDPNGQLDANERSDLLKVILRNSSMNNMGDESRLADEWAYSGSRNSKKLSSHMSGFFSKLTDEQRLKFEKLHNKLGSNIGDPRDFIQLQMDLGNQAYLYKTGLVDRKTGEIDLEKLMDLYLSASSSAGYGLGPEIFGPHKPTAKEHLGRTLLKRKDKIKQDIISAAAGAKGKLDEVINDVFVPGEVTPRLKAALIRQGEYISVKTNKVIYDLKDITGPIMDKAGNIVVDQYEAAKLVFKDEKSKVVKRVSTISPNLSSSVDSISQQIKQKAASTATNAYEEIRKNFAEELTKQDQSEATEPNDVYVGGEQEPRLTAAKMKAGEYASKQTGKPIFCPKDIDGPVMNKKGQTLIDSDDLSKMRIFSRTLGMFSPLRLAITALKKLGSGVWYYQTKIAPKWAAFNLRMLWKVTKTVGKLSGRLLGFTARHAGLLPAQDLYSKYTGRISIYGSVLKAGKYFSAKTGQIIQSLKDIDGPVLDENNQHVVTDQDLQAGLQTADGQSVPIGKQAQEMAEKAKGVMSRNFDSLKQKTSGLFKKEKSLMEDPELAERRLRNMTPEKMMDSVKGSFSQIRKRFGLSREEVGNLEIRKLLSDIRDGLEKPTDRLGSVADQIRKRLSRKKKGKEQTASVPSGKADKSGVLELLSNLLPKTGLLGAAVSAAGAATTAGAAVAGFGAKAAIGALGGALTMAGGAAGLAGLIFSAPVIGAAALGLAGYGAYKLYKYLSKGNLSKLDLLRVVQYGFMPDDKERWSTALDIESASYKALKKDGKGFKIDYEKLRLSELMGPFGLTEHSAVHRSRLIEWYKTRFEPVFLTHITALNAVANTTDLSTVSSLKGEPKGKYFEAAKFSDGPYHYRMLPYPDNVKVRVSGAEEVAKVIEAVYAENKSKSENKSGIIPIPGAKAAMIPSDPTNRGNVKIPDAEKLSIPDANISLTAGSASVLSDDGVTLLAFDAIRYKAYGASKLESRFIQSLIAVEQSSLKKLRYASDGRAVWDGNVTQVLSEVKGLFRVSGFFEPRAKQWMAWYKDRFLPVYLAFQTAYRKRAGSSFDRALGNKLDVKQQLDVVNAMLSAGNAWSVVSNPWPDGVINTDAQSVNENINHLHKTAEIRQLQEQKSNSKTIANSRPAFSKQPILNKQVTGDRVTKSGNSPDYEARPEGSGGGGFAAPKYDASGIKLLGGDYLDGRSANAFIKLSKDADVEGLNPQFKQQLFGAIEEYGRMTGKPVNINEAFRTRARQEALKRKYGDRAAAPGTSLHEYGLAVDIDGKTLDEMDRLGILRKYGLTRPVGQEAWHLEPIGIQGDLNAYKKDSKLAEKAIRNGLGRGGGGLGSMGDRAPKYARSTALSQQISKLNVPPTNSNAAKEPEMVSAATAPNSSRIEFKSKSATKMASNDHKFVTPKEYVEAARNNPTKKTPIGSLDKEFVPSSNTAGGSIEDMKSVIVQSAKTVGIDPTLMLGTTAMESDFKANAEASTSSAKGPLQFTGATWRESILKYGKQYGYTLENTSPNDIKAASLMAAHYYKANLPAIESILGRKATVPEAYMTHLLGRGGASSFFRNLQSSPDSIAASVMPAAAKSNPNLFYKNGVALSFAQVFDLINGKADTKMAAYGIGKNQTYADVSDKVAPGAIRASYEPGKQASERIVSPPKMDASAVAPKKAAALGMGRSTETVYNQSSNQLSSGVSEILSKSLQKQTDMLSVLTEIRDVVVGGQKTPKSAPAEATPVKQEAPYMPPNPALHFRRSA